MDVKPNNDSISDDELYCDVCGMTYKEFLETGIFRCENCYRVFKYRTIELIKNSMKKEKMKRKPQIIKSVSLSSTSSKISLKEIKEKISSLEKLLKLAKQVDDKEKIKILEDEINKLKLIEMEH